MPMPRLASASRRLTRYGGHFRRDLSAPSGAESAFLDSVGVPESTADGTPARAGDFYKRRCRAPSSNARALKGAY